MKVSLNKEKFLQESEILKEKYNLHTQEDFEKFVKESPELLEAAIAEAGCAVKESMVGKSFDELTLEDMEQLQAAGGDVSPETTFICFLGSLGVGGAISILKC